MTDDILKKLDYLDDTKQLIRKAIESKGPIITDEDPLRSYADKINNIESLDPNTAKIFKNKEEMNQDEKVFIGKKAIIYNRDMMPLNRENKITNIEIPETFILSDVCDQTYSAEYYGNGSHLYLSLNNTEAALHLQILTPSGSGYVENYYKSEDGINYSYSSGSHSNKYSTIFGIFEFEYPMTYEQGNWSNLFGDMIKVNNSEFHGLYEYTNKYEDTKYANIFNNFQLDETNKFTYTTTPLYIADIQTKIRTIMSNATDLSRTSYYGLTRITEYENDVPKTIEIYHSGYPLLTNNKLKCILTTYNSEPASIPTYTKLVIDLINMTVKEETASTLIETVKAIDSTYYIATIKDIENDIPCFKFRVYTYGSSNVMSFNYSYVIDDVIFNAYEYNIYYKKPRYTVAPTQLTDIQKNQIFENQVVYGNNGIVKGDKSYLTNIKNNDFVNTWLPGLTYNSAYTNLIQGGTPVSYQTFVERRLISYLDTDKQDSADSVTEFITKLNEEITTLPETDTLYKIYKSFSIYSRTMRYNNKVYWYALGVNWSNTTSYHQVTSINGVVYDAETMERVYEFTDNTTWQPINTGTTPEERYCGINFMQFIPERNEFVVLFDTANWGWTHGAWGAIYRYNVVTKGRFVQQSINVGKHGAGTYYNLDESTFDASTNCFYCVVAGFDSQGANTKKQYIVKIDSSANVSVVYTDTSVTSLTSTNGSFWTQHLDVGSLFIYYQSADKTTKIVNLANSKVLTINNYANSFYNETFVKHNNDYYILYKTNVDNVYTLYVDKLNLTNMTKTNIVTWVTNNNFSFYYVDKELCLYDYQNCKLYNFDKEYLFTTKISDNTLKRGISGLVINNGDVETEAAYFNVTTGNMQLTTYKRSLNYYVYKDIVTYPITGELFVTSRPTSTSTKDAYTYKYESCQLTQLKVSDKQYQQYLDSMDHLLEDDNIE